jgi:hypothetical protein
MEEIGSLVPVLESVKIRQGYYNPHGLEIIG